MILGDDAILNSADVCEGKSGDHFDRNRKDG
jgi:hypothetical protein